MTHQEVLEKAISRAVDNGYDGYIPHRVSSISKYRDGDFSLDNINQLIFNHEFARALWGKERIKGAMLASPNEKHYLHHEANAIREYALYKNSGWHPAFKLHLQNMVIADDPIIYLKENI